MSKVSKGIYSNSSGKLGNVVFSSWKGIEYVRSKPSVIRNPRTPGQEMQRSKFALLSGIIYPLLPFIRIGFGGYAIRMSACIAAMSYNIKNAVTGTPPDPVIDFEKLTFSRGLLPGVKNAWCKLANEKSVELDWDKGPLPAGAGNDDSIMAIVYNETKNESLYIPHLATRAKGKAVIDLSTAEAGDIVHYYLSVMDMIKALSGTGKYGISDSCYAGKLRIE